VSQRKSLAAGPSPDVQQPKPMNGETLGSDSTRNDWLQVDLLEFLATTVDLRVVLFQSEEPSFLSASS
jgi:hypothetical protein